MPKKEITFEEAIDKLEEIVNSLESGDFALEESLKLYEEGVKLVNLCNKKIENVEKSVKILLNSAGELIEEDFVSDVK